MSLIRLNKISDVEKCSRNVQQISIDFESTSDSRVESTLWTFRHGMDPTALVIILIKETLENCDPSFLSLS